MFRGIRRGHARAPFVTQSSERGIMRICVIMTGGTIGSAGSPLAPIPGPDFAAAAAGLLGEGLGPGLNLSFDSRLRFDSATGMLDSTDLRPADWCRIAEHIIDIYADFDGFIVLHGTDTMDFTAAALSFLLNVFDQVGMGRAVLSKPVILTGSQLPLFIQTGDRLILNAGSDACANLAGALAATRLRLPEVGLFFDGRLWRGNRALKTSTTRFAGFDSPHLPPLAEVGIGTWHGSAVPLPGPAAPHLALDDPQARALARAQVQAVQTGLQANPVVGLTVAPADQALLAGQIRDALSRGIRGMVIEGYGEGNLPQGDGALDAALREARALGATVGIASRVIGGEVGDFHYQAGAWIAKTGVIGLGAMTPVTALAKLTILLAAAKLHGWNQVGLHSLMRRDLAGEGSGRDRLAPGEVLWPGMSLMAADGDATLSNDPDIGLILRDGSGRTLWSVGQPGKLILRDRPVFQGCDGTVLWQASGRLAGGTMILTASPALRLTLHDPQLMAAPVGLFG